jgi:hypothetical protein
MSDNITEQVKTVTALQVQVASGESVAINGFTIDRIGYHGGIYACQIGNASGDPVSFGVNFRVQEKSGETDWVNVSGMSLSVSGETLASENKLTGEINMDFKGCGRYTRLVATPNFNGGSSPKVEIGAVLVLGEAQVLPV